MVIIPSAFLLCLIKADVHFKYLKSIGDQDALRFESFLLTGLRVYNPYAFLLLPFFERSISKEKSLVSRRYAKRVLFCCISVWVTIAVMVAYVLILVVLSDRD